MARDEFRVHGARDLLEISLAPLVQEQREEIDLEEKIAELVTEFGGVVRLRGVGDLVRLLDRVRDDRPRCLLAIPRAVAAQSLGELLELFERLPELAILAGRYSLSGRDGRSDRRTREASIAQCYWRDRGRTCGASSALRRHK